MIVRQSRPICTLVLPCLLLLASCASNPSTPTTNSPDQSTTTEQQAFNGLVSKGDEALSRRDYDNAQVQYALAIKEQPSNIELLYKLAIVHYEKQSFDVARELLLSIVNKNSEHIGAHEMLGLIALKKENIATAEDHLNNAISLDNNRWRSQNAMGIVKDLQSKHVEAQQHFKLALRNSPMEAQTENNLGYSYYLDSNYQLAEQHFRKATQLNPNYDKAWANLGLVFTRNKQYEEARYAFSKVVDDHIASNNLGYLSMLQGDEEMARQELARAILIAPTYYPKASENLTSLNTRSNEPSFLDSTALSSSAVGKNKDTTLADTQSIAVTSPVANTNTIIATPLPQENIEFDLGKPTNEQAEIVIKESTYTAPVKKAPKPIAKLKPITPDLSKYYLNILGYGNRDTKDSFDGSVLSFQVAHQLEPSGVLNNTSSELLSSEALQRVRSLLRSLNYDASSDSAKLDKETIASLKAFQQNNSLPISGDIDKSTLSALLRYLNGGAVAANSQ